LIKKEYELAALLIKNSCFLKKSKISGVITFIKILPQILQVRQISKSKTFWKNLMIGILLDFRSTFKRKIND
jgi:hypothetical protein